MVEISVILPVYNSENYIKECLDSLLSQTFKDIEILCIDDGSTDGSLNILKDIEKTDSRITVITQENMGVAKTRNNGLNLVKGNYVYFMDSDDCLDKNAFKKLHDNITSNRSDFCIMKVIFVNGSEEYKFPAFDIDKEFDKVNFNDFTFTYRDVKSHVLNDLFAPWLKLYSAEFLKSNDDFTFPEIKSYSDAPFHVKTMLNASRISFVPEYLYYYRENDRKRYSKNITDNQDIQKEIVHLLSMFEVSFTPKQRKNYLFYCMVFLFDNYELKETDYLEFLRNLANNYFYNVYLNHDNLNERNQPVPNAFDNALLENRQLKVGKIEVDRIAYRLAFEEIYEQGRADVPLFIFNYHKMIKN